MFNEVVAFLMPFFGRESEREALLLNAFYNQNALLGKINYSGAAAEFVPRLVYILQTYGEITSGTQALWQLLLMLKAEVGPDKQRQVDTFQVWANAAQSNAALGSPLLSTNAVGEIKMSSLKEAKRKQLQANHALKIKQFEDVSTALRLNMNPNNKANLEGMIDEIESELQKLEQSLLALGPSQTSESNGNPGSGVNIEGNVGGSNVNIGGTQIVTINYGHIVKTIQKGTGASSDKEKLEALMTELKRALEDVPTDQKDAADKVVNRTEELIVEASAPTVEKEAVEMKANLLRRAAENVSEVLPVVFGISTRILSYILRMASIGI